MNSITVEGNKVGTNAAGTQAVANGAWGVYVDDSPNDVVNNNLISGNDQGGVAFRGIDSTNELVQGNDIGTDITGTYALGNAYSGIYVGNWGVTGDGPSNVTIGGTSAGDGNVVSANGNWGVWISGSGTTDVVVEGNEIGTNASGTAALGNSDDGVQIDSVRRATRSAERPLAPATSSRETATGGSSSPAMGRARTSLPGTRSALGRSVTPTAGFSSVTAPQQRWRAM